MTATAPAPAIEPRVRAPIGMLAELTHRCPLQCPYCSNPLELERVAGELPTQVWLDVLAQAAELGVLQLHLSGGEPTVRQDLEAIVAQAAKVGLYSNLITAAVTLTRERLDRLAAAGLDHVQISIQDAAPDNADRIAHYRGGHAKKLEAARWVREIGLPLTINAPIHRQNIASLPAIIDLAVSLGARRLEVAHVQYYGWALRNRQALMPTRQQVLTSAQLVERARERLEGRARHRLRGARLLREPAEAVHGRLGTRQPQHHAVGQSIALPRRRDHSRPRLRECARQVPARDLVGVGGLQPLPRHRLDARALPLLCVPRSGLGRLPLPGPRLRR